MATKMFKNIKHFNCAEKLKPINMKRYNSEKT